MSTQTIQYGTMILPFSKLSVAQETVYSENGVDHLGIAYTFTVTGWLTAPDEATFAALINQVKCQLNTPRQGFDVIWNGGGGDQVLYSFDNTGNDILWGPKPNTVNIGPFLGGKAALYSWQLRVVVKQCYDGSCSATDAPSDVLTITRRFEHRVNENGYTTRTISGVLVVTSHSVQDGRPADTFRFLVTPNLPTWYRRVSEDYSQSEDGTRLSYSITDQEMQWTLPRPITSGRASYTQRLAWDGMRMDYSLSGEFSAPANVSKKTIIEQILQLAQDRFPLTGDVALIPVQREFTEEIYESNTIRFTMSCWSAAGAGVDPLDMFVGVPKFGAQPTNSDGQSQLIGVYGGDGVGVTSGVVADAISIYDACNPASVSSRSVTAPSGNGGEAGGNPPGGDNGNTGPTGPTGDDPSGQNSGASADHKIAPYFQVHEEISWEVDNGWRVHYPKVVGAKPVKQQVRPPKTMVIQAGYISRDAPSDQPDLKPKTPAAIYADTDCVMHRFSVKPETPIPLGTGGYTRWTVHYDYLMELTTTPNTMDDIGIQFPIDPRRDSGQDSATLKIADMPKILNVPT